MFFENVPIQDKNQGQSQMLDLQVHQYRQMS